MYIESRKFMVIETGSRQYHYEKMKDCLKTLILVEECRITMNTVSKVTVACILAILVVVISSGYNMVQVNAQGRTIRSEQKPCTTNGEAAICGMVEEVQITPAEVAGCKHLQAKMADATDPESKWSADLFNTLDCADVIARSAIANTP
jgi:hypothetical protein